MSDARLHEIEDPLFLALTRPAMVGGVTYAALLVCGVVSLESFLISRNLLALGLFAPLYALAWLVCRQEPRAFELLMLAARDGVPLKAGSPWRAGSAAVLVHERPDWRGCRPIPAVSMPRTGVL